MVSATAGAARSAVAGSFHTCLAEHRARATGVSLSHRPDELLFNNSATRALYDQDVHLLEASACQRVRIKVLEGGFRDSSARSDMQGLGMIESRYQQHKASGGRFLIVDAHGFESVLDGAIKFERKPLRTRDRSRDEMPKLILLLREIFRP